MIGQVERSSLFDWLDVCQSRFDDDGAAVMRMLWVSIPTTHLKRNCMKENLHNI